MSRFSAVLLATLATLMAEPVLVPSRSRIPGIPISTPNGVRVDSAAPELVPMRVTLDPDTRVVLAPDGAKADVAHEGSAAEDGWVNIKTRETFSYLVRLEDAAVQEALREALPVSRLHKQIGPCEMVSLEFLSEDRAVQATAFSDGTCVVANLSERPAEAPDVGVLPPHSWRRL